MRMYDVGNRKKPKEKWDIILGLRSKHRVQISDLALEACRTNMNRRLQKRIGRERFHLRIRVHPYHIYRENKMMAFAGADRLQTGMRGSFGKPTGLCARVNAGQLIIELRVDERDLQVAKDAMRIAGYKFCTSCQTVLLDCKTPEIKKRVGLPDYVG